jgi:hypothetical protein
VHPAGTWVITSDQEYAALAREVLDVQKYPDLRQYPGGPPERPYDAAGWTLPLQMGVRVVRYRLLSVPRRARTSCPLVRRSTRSCGQRRKSAIARRGAFRQRARHRLQHQSGCGRYRSSCGPPDRLRPFAGGRSCREQRVPEPSRADGRKAARCSSSRRLDRGAR